MATCPTCHSFINITGTQKEELRQQGIYVWTDDPLLTIQGLSGDSYKGLIFINQQHIKELQEARERQEIDAEISISQRTNFTSFDSITDPVTKSHINELRESTEKILTALNLNLQTYFNYYRDGSYHGSYEYGVKIADKTEWTDVDRTTGKPHLPSDTFIRAIHIEELRHQLPVTEPVVPIIGIYPYPTSMNFNLRCLQAEYQEFQVYSNLEEVTSESEYQIPDPGGGVVAELINYTNKVKPLAPGTARVAISYDTETKVFHTEIPISVFYQVSYSGNLDLVVEPNRVYFTGSATGCDGSSIDIETDGVTIEGTFDGEDFDIPFSSISSTTTWFAKVGEIYEQILSPPIEFPSWQSPPYMEGKYIVNMGSSFSDYYAVAGYNVWGWMLTRYTVFWEYQLIDKNGDGILDTYRRTVVDYELDNGSFFLNFVKDS